VIIANGSVPLVPNVPGMDKDIVVLAPEVLLGKETGQRVVVAGGGLIGCETAEFLREKGKDVTIVEMLPKIGADIGPATRFYTLARLQKIGIEMRPKAKVIEVTDGSIVVDCEGEQVSIPADTVVVATGMKADTELYDSVRAQLPAGSPIKIHPIGDCVTARRIADAIREGWQVACQI